MQWKVSKNVYYKGKNLISGMELPTDNDGCVRDYIFIQCDFHPACRQVEFLNCVFVDCFGSDKLTIHNSTIHN